MPDGGAFNLTDNNWVHGLTHRLIMQLRALLKWLAGIQEKNKKEM
jgi:hypothetical protein